MQVSPLEREKRLLKARVYHRVDEIILSGHEADQIIAEINDASGKKKLEAIEKQCYLAARPRGRHRLEAGNR